MFQLVLQLSPWGSGITDLDALITLEDQLTDALRGTGAVDGHDIGSNEANVFVITDHVERAISACIPVIDRSGLLGHLSAGYRVIGADRYFRAWPVDDDSSFSVK